MEKSRFPASLIYLLLFLAACFFACAKTGNKPQQAAQMSMLEDVRADKTLDTLQLKPLPIEPEPERDIMSEQTSLIEEELKYKAATQESTVTRKIKEPSPLPEEPKGK